MNKFVVDNVYYTRYNIDRKQYYMIYNIVEYICCATYDLNKR